MSTNNKQASNGPILCKADCGFFGSEATGGCCSKCWMSSIKKQTPAAPVTADVDVDNVNNVVDNSERTQTSTNDNKTDISKTSAKIAETTTLLQANESSTSTSTSKSTAVDGIAIATTPTPAVIAPLKKKKKKKTGYKNMMASMMSGSDKKDIAKEKEILAKGLGGGVFSKIEKI